MRKGVILIDSLRTPDQLRHIMLEHTKFLGSDWNGVIISDKDLVSSMREYNCLLANLEFWKALPFDKVLIIQHDSGLLRSGIDEFLEWDYVGAPWKFQEHGGNGGLSLRSVKTMIEVIETVPYEKANCNEDVYFCNAMRLLNIGKLAPRNICAKFSVESEYQLGTLGYHAIDKYISQDQCKTILTQYNESSN